VAPQRQTPSAPAPQPPVPASTPAAPAPEARRGALARAFENTPGRLRLAVLVSVVVCLIFALLGANAFRSRGEALNAARNGAEQVVRVQGIATNLARADAVVTNAFLLGGTASPSALQQFDQFVAQASADIAEAARAQPGDAAALAGVNQSLTRYSAAIAAANANNRLGNEVGSAYLRQASKLLRTPSDTDAAMLPTLQSVADTDAQRVDDAFAAASRSLLSLLAAGIVVLGALLAVQVWLARRTRRMFNVPLTAGTVTVFVTLAFGAFAMFGSQSAADTVRDTHYAAAKGLAQARISGYDARANESLTLVYRGTGQDYEKAWQAGYKRAADGLAVAANTGLSDVGIRELGQWTEVHKEIRRLDDAGQWDAAVGRATGAGKTDSAPVFGGFAEKAQQALTTEAVAVRSGLDSSENLLGILGWLTLVLGLVSAVLAWRGIAQRLEEYR
jgi:preprotein translocase subunit SecG